MRTATTSVTLGLLVAASAVASPIEAFSSNPQVTIRNGTVRGTAIPDLGAEAFLGLRYARAPVSDLSSCK